MDETARVLGALEARVGNLEVGMTNVQADLKVLIADRVASNAVRVWAGRLLPFVALGVSIAALFAR